MAVPSPGDESLAALRPLPARRAETDGRASAGALQSLLESLPEQTAHAVSVRFGIQNGCEATLRQVGEAIEGSEQRASQLVSEGLRLLRTAKGEAYCDDIRTELIGALWRHGDPATLSSLGEDMKLIKAFNPSSPTGVILLLSAAHSFITVTAIHDVLVVTTLSRSDTARLTRSLNNADSWNLANGSRASIAKLAAANPSVDPALLRRFIEIAVSRRRTVVSYQAILPRRHRPGGRVREEELDRAVSAAGEIGRGIDEKLARGLPNVSAETRFQWAILKAAVGDGEGVYQLLRDLVAGDSPFPAASLRAVMTLARR